MKNLFYTLLLIFGTMNLSAQIADGSMAPDFTVTDLNGNTHNLQSYLDQGIHVLLDFSATWCGPCWNYHQGHAMEDMYNTYGPNATGEVQVIYIEGDGSTNTDCIYDLPGCNSSTWGDWTIGTSYPMTDLTGSNLNITNASNYNINYWPTIYGVNANDGRVFEVGQPTFSGWETIVFQSFELEAQAVAIPGDCDFGSIEITTTGGFGTLNYAWSAPSVGNTPLAENLLSGTYSVVVTDANGIFVEVQNITLVNNPIDVSLDAETVSSLECYGDSNGSIDIDVSSGSPLSFQWSNGATTEDISGLSTGWYDVIITNTVNGCDIEASYFVDSPTELFMGSSSTPTECEDLSGTITLTSSGGVGPYMYDIGFGPTFNPVFTDLANGTYNSIVTDAMGCAVSEAVVVDNIPTPIAEIGADGELGCSTSSVELNAFNSSFGSEYDVTWTGPNGENLGSGLTIDVTDPGVYNIYIEDINTGCFASDDYEVVETGDGPSIDVDGELQLDCANSTTVLNITNDPNTFDLSWTYVDADGNTVTVTGAEITVENPGVYTANVVDPVNGCDGTEEYIVLENYDEPYFTVEANATIECSNQSINLESQGDVDNVSISWSSVDGNIVEGGDTYNPLVDAPGLYVIEVINNLTGCVASDEVTVIFDSNDPLADFQSMNSDVLTIDFTDISEGTGLAYSWDFGDGSTSTEQNPSYTYGEEGTYTVCLTVENTCGSNTTCNDVSFGGALSVDKVVVNESCFEAADGEISVTASGGTPGYNIDWQGPNGFTSQEFTITDLAPGTYSFTLVDAANTSFEDDYIVVAAEQIILSSSLIQDEIAGNGAGFIELSLVGGTGTYTYEWSNGATTPNIYDLTQGTYTLVVTDENLCSRSFDFEIENATSVEEIESLVHFKLFPQPASDLLNINVSNNSGERMTINLISTDGKVLETRVYDQAEFTDTWSVDNLSAGLYLMKLTQSNQVVTKPVVIIK